MSDPDGLVDDLTDVDWTKDRLENESLAYAADDVLAKRLGEDAADAIDDGAAAVLDDDPTGHRMPERTVDARFPRLAAWSRTHRQD